MPVVVLHKMDAAQAVPVHSLRICSQRLVPHPEQKCAPCGLVCPQRRQASSVPGCGAGGTLMVTFHGWPHPGIAIPRVAAIPAA